MRLGNSQRPGVHGKLVTCQQLKLCVTKSLCIEKFSYRENPASYPAHSKLSFLLSGLADASILVLNNVVLESISCFLQRENKAYLIDRQRISLSPSRSTLRNMRS